MPEDAVQFGPEPRGRVYLDDESRYGGPYQIKDPTRFLNRLKAAPDNDKLSQAVRRQLKDPALPEEWDETRKVTHILNGSKRLRKLAAKDEDILDLFKSRPVNANEMLCREFKDLYGGTLYFRNPEALLLTAGKRSAESKPNLLAEAVKQWFTSDELAAISKAAGVKPESRSPEEAARVAVGVHRMTLLLNEPGKIDRNVIDAQFGDAVDDLMNFASPERLGRRQDESQLPQSDEAPSDPVDLRLILALARTHRYALCLSGGGIRSATFNLGVLQAVARNGFLEQFEFLSTVSGGGFIGGWLSAWINRNGNGLAGVAELLSNVRESRPIRFLRSYSNYLAPRTGFLSVDTWVIVATYLRNLFVTWLTFVPFLLFALVLPRVMYAATFSPSVSPLQTLVAGALLGIIGVGFISLRLPSLSTSPPAMNSVIATEIEQSRFIAFALVPMTASAWFLSKFAWEFYGKISLWEVVVLAAVIVLFPWARFIVLNGLTPTIVGVTALLSLSVAISGGAAYLSLDYRAWFTGVSGQILYLCLAPPAVLVLMLISATIIAAVTSHYSNLEDQEWWARSGSYVLLVTGGWSAVLLISLYAPQYVVVTANPAEIFSRIRGFFLSPTGIGFLKGFVNAAGIAATIGSVLGGKSSRTSAGETSRSFLSTDTLISVLSPVAVVYIVICLNTGLDELLARFSALLPRFGKWLQQSNLALVSPDDHFHIVDSSSWTDLLLAMAILGAVIVSTHLLVNGNKFTPHYFYRNRIIRAFLGASREATARTPDPFTGLDDDDNLEMWRLRGQRPRHVINMALNLTGSDRLEWQERKAEVFTVTSALCGSPWLGYRDARVYGGGNNNKFGISLGTAVAISGAAVSPNMGYMLNSSAARFLMASFAVRLGCWLGNPGEPGQSTFAQSAPPSSLLPILNEAFGRTNENSKFVYLSDGGHFENLGLYEMVRRGCTQVVVVDASTDSDYEFESLAVSLRKIRIDFGISVEFDHFGDIGRFHDETGHYCAIGKIRYSEHDSALQDGTVLYIKASLRGVEPRDVIQYSKTSGSFPQQTIADQFFSESQFESYRMLGFHIATEIASRSAHQPLPILMAGIEQELVKNGNRDRKNLVDSALKRAAHG
jgi:hypothetical protein